MINSGPKIYDQNGSCHLETAIRTPPKLLDNKPRIHVSYVYKRPQTNTSNNNKKCKTSNYPPTNLLPCQEKLPTFINHINKNKSKDIAVMVLNCVPQIMSTSKIENLLFRRAIQIPPSRLNFHEVCPIHISVED